MNLTIGIDPGPETSDAVVLDSEGLVVGKISCPNGEMYACVDNWKQQGERVVVEDFVPYGARLSYESMDTIKFIGALFWAHGCEVLSRKAIKLHLCGIASATNANVKDALVHEYGGSRERAVGKKKTPGPLYGITDHLWAALAVAVTAADLAAAQAAGGEK